MKSCFLRTILIAAISLGPVSAFAASTTDAATDDETAAHAAVLELAGAFTNAGFKLRDGDYTGALKTGQAVVIQVNLYAGNEYWFSVAAADLKTAASISLYDETGKLVKSNPYTDPHRAAAGFSPDTSGPYYVRIAAPGAPITYCFIYSYK